MLLKVTDLNVYYGAIHALKGLSFEVGEGEIVSLIGANGAGKTTAMHTVSGLLRSPDGLGRVYGYQYHQNRAPPDRQNGVGASPGGAARVREHVGAGKSRDGRVYPHCGLQKGIDEDLEMVFTRFPRLKERRKQVAGTLSGGEQQMLAIGRALMSRPRMLLLDEPSMGLSPILVQEIFSCITEVNRGGTTILLVEQNAKMALTVSDRAYVLETGSVVLEGRAADLLDNEQVKEAYLGA